MSEDLTVIIEENPVSLVFDDQSMRVFIEEQNTTVLVPQEVTQVTLSNQDLKILTVAEQGPPGASGISSGDAIDASQVINEPGTGSSRHTVKQALAEDQSNIEILSAQVQDVVDNWLPNLIDPRFGEYFLQDGVKILTSATPSNDYELVNKEYVDSVAGSGGGTVMFPMTVSTTAPSNPTVGQLWLDMN